MYCPIKDGKPVTNFPNYRITKDGILWSYKKYRNGKIDPRWKPIEPEIDKTGRCRYCLYNENGCTRKHNYIIVLEEFVGPRPKGMVGCHNDGNPSNNHLDNLRWDTQKGNLSDRKLHGTHPIGEKHHGSVLKEHQVLEIRRLSSIGLSNGEIASMFGMDRTTISKIILRKLWKHI